jgi:DHA1 family multidrug resistance protein-like MFS transporter
MGMLQTAQFVGLSLGPVMGGLAATAWGFRGAFWAASALMAGNFLLSLFVIKDAKPGTVQARRRGGGGPRLSFMGRLRLVAKLPPLRAPILAVLAYQTSYVISVTLLPLHVHAIAGGEADAAAAVGLVLTTTAIGSAIGSTAMGLLGSRIGPKKVALLAFFLTAALLIPQTFITDTVTFAVLRFFMGFCAGGVLPALRTLLAESAGQNEETAASMGSIYGLSQSAFSGGMAMGALLASFVGGLFGLASTYMVAGALISLTGLWWITQMGNWRPVAPPATS